MELLEAMRHGPITRQMMEDALLEYFRFLRSMMLDYLETQMEGGWLELRRMTITYPNYLYAYKQSRNFHRYISYYLGLICRI